MSGKTIATIYFYIISAASLALIIIGIFNGVNFVINSTQYDKYPSRFNAVYSCDFPYEGPYRGPYPVKGLGPEEATPSAADQERSRQQCIKNEAADRKQHQVDDLKNASTFSLVGIVLFLIHFPQARKFSKD